ncbi:hypothetical protein CY34DRAFT_685672 [Suillus luteus UH-Slu-Lm8-n1]|uniref:Uncharacterized protein n=1 Tax=Suillus luteus UH-Slu-Lm8-n1 TaxID=930992 RepID=A0A0D0APP3_9AGAM|nr:hypothetical protein CY34DRAFT_685672 [Suillus luteus UH-Slu-Lm8-n1]
MGRILICARVDRGFSMYPHVPWRSLKFESINVQTYQLSDRVPNIHCRLACLQSDPAAEFSICTGTSTCILVRLSGSFSARVRYGTQSPRFCIQHGAKDPPLIFVRGGCRDVKVDPFPSCRQAFEKVHPAVMSIFHSRTR